MTTTEDQMVLTETTENPTASVAEALAKIKRNTIIVIPGGLKAEHRETFAKACVAFHNDWPKNQSGEMKSGCGWVDPAAITITDEEWPDPDHLPGYEGWHPLLSLVATEDDEYEPHSCFGGLCMWIYERREGTFERAAVYEGLSEYAVENFGSMEFFFEVLSAQWALMLERPMVSRLAAMFYHYMPELPPEEVEDEVLLAVYSYIDYRYGNRPTVTWTMLRELAKLDPADESVPDTERNAIVLRLFEAYRRRLVFNPSLSKLQELMLRWSYDLSGSYYWLLTQLENGTLLQQRSRLLHCLAQPTFELSTRVTAASDGHIGYPVTLIAVPDRFAMVTMNGIDMPQLAAANRSSHTLWKDYFQVYLTDILGYPKIHMLNLQE